MAFKGEYIFSGVEKDRKSAITFLVMLLDCIEKWALANPIAEDGKTPSIFAKTLAMLQQKNIMFPSQCSVNPLTGEQSRSSR